MAVVAGLLGLLAISTVATFFAGCATHELGHAIVGTALGYEVVAIEICPANASVSWAASDLAPIDASVEAWAGGILAAAVLAAVYLVVFALPRRPERSVAWWIAGLPLLPIAGVQLLMGVMEGATQGLYGEAIDRHPGIWIPLIGAMALGGAALHVVLWWPRRERWASD